MSSKPFSSIQYSREGPFSCSRRCHDEFARALAVPIQSHNPKAAALSVSVLAMNTNTRCGTRSVNFDSVTTRDDRLRKETYGDMTRPCAHAYGQEPEWQSGPDRFESQLRRGPLFPCPDAQRHR